MVRLGRAEKIAIFAELDLIDLALWNSEPILVL